MGNKKKVPKLSNRQKSGVLIKDLRKVNVNEYVNNAIFYEQMVISKANGELTPLALDCYILLTNKAIMSFPYSKPEDKLDCLSSAYADFINYALKNFQIERKNAVAYFTTMAYNGIMKGWNKLYPKKLKRIKYIITYLGEYLFSSFDEEIALENLEIIKMTYPANMRKHVKLETVNISANVSLDSFNEDEDTGVGIYNL